MNINNLNWCIKSQIKEITIQNQLNLSIVMKYSISMNYESRTGDILGQGLSEGPIWLCDL